MSDTNRVRVSIARTSQRGGSGVSPSPVDPANFATPNSLFQLRYTGTPGLGSQPNSVVSNEIRSDRQTADSILVGTEAGGNVEGELSMLTFDELIQGTLFTSYKQTQVSTIASVGAGTITLDADSGDTNSSGVLDGMIIRVQLPDNTPSIDAMYYVASKAVDTITVTPLRAEDNAIAGTETITNGSVTVCGMRADTAATDLSIALDTPVAGQSTITFTNEMATNWAAAYPNVAGTAMTLPVIGSWIKLSQTVDAVQAVYARLIAVTSTTAVIETPTGFTSTVQTGNPEVYWGSFIRNPVLQASDTPSNIGEFVPTSIPANMFLIERRYEDHNPITRELLTGCAINQFNLTFDPQSILNLSVEFFGFKSNVSDASGASYNDIYTSLPTDVEPTDTDVINTSTNVGVVSLTGQNLLAVSDLCAAKNLPLQVQLNIGNQLRRRNAVGVFGAACIGAGRLNIGGNVNTYFDDKQILDLIVQNLDAEYTVSVASNDGRGLLFDLPRIKFTSGAPDVPGGDQDAVLNPAYQALRSPDFGYTIHLTRWEFVR